MKLLGKSDDNVLPVKLLVSLEEKLLEAVGRIDASPEDELGALEELAEPEASDLVFEERLELQSSLVVPGGTDVGSRVLAGCTTIFVIIPFGPVLVIVVNKEPE